MPLISLPPPLCRRRHPPPLPPSPASTLVDAPAQEDADHSALKKAFFRKSKELHPDKVEEERKEEATLMFQKINAAYQVGRAFCASGQEAAGVVGPGLGLRLKVPAG